MTHLTNNIFTVSRLLVLLALLVAGLSTSPFATANKIYKAVDADGKVYFTDKNPNHISTIDAVESEEISVKKDSSNKTRIVSIGDSSYCGHIQLPQKKTADNSYYKNRPEYYYKSLSRKRDEWQRSLKKYEQQLSSKSYQYNYYSSSRYRRSSNYNNTHNPETIEKMRDYRCALTWANQQANTLNNQQDSLDKNIHKLKSSLTNLQNTQQRVCGNEPIYDPSDTYLLDKWNRWNKCNEPYKSLISETAKKINHSDAELSTIRNYLHTLNNRP